MLSNARQLSIAVALYTEDHSILPPSALKPLHARHSARGDDSGRAVLIFGDGHAELSTAVAILAQEEGAGLHGQVRPAPNQTGR